MKKTFSLGISTLNDGIFKIKLPKEDPRLNIIIVHQIHQENRIKYRKEIERITSDRTDVEYIALDEKGLSKSRNTILSSSKSDYTLISDDDVVYDENLVDNLDYAIKHNDFDVFIFKISSDESDYKNYSHKKKKLKKIQTAKVSSVEMLVSTKFIKSSNVFFNEEFGLGSKYPSGEEFIFCSNIIDAGGIIGFIPKYVSYHPKESSGKDFFSSPNLMRAKREMFRLCFKRMSIIYATLFTIKKIPVLIRNRKLLDFIGVMYFEK